MRGTGDDHHDDRPTDDNYRRTDDHDDADHLDLVDDFNRAAHDHHDHVDHDHELHNHDRPHHDHVDHDHELHNHDEYHRSAARGRPGPDQDGRQPDPECGRHHRLPGHPDGQR